jgi:hypothetical protein
MSCNLWHWRWQDCNLPFFCVLRAALVSSKRLANIFTAHGINSPQKVGICRGQIGEPLNGSANGKKEKMCIFAETWGKRKSVLATKCVSVK